MTINTLTKLIEDHQAHIEDDVRDYIGASSIGSNCFRQIWYGYKGFKGEGVSPKTRRTWDIGKNLEGLIVKWLENAGAEIITTNLDYSAKELPFFRGHYDALLILEKRPYILEIKTAKDASFKVFADKGLRLWNPQYYAQIQSYMGMSEIYNAYILVLNKDSSVISDELVLFDEEFYKGLEDKAKMIASANMPPPRINSSPLWFECKLCKFNKVCHS